MVDHIAGQNRSDIRRNGENGKSIIDLLIIFAEQKKIIISTLIVFIAAGLIYAQVFTKIKYSSELQMLPITSDMFVGAESRIVTSPAIVKAVILGNSTLDAVIGEFGLLKDEDGSKMTLNQTRSSLRDNITVIANDKKNNGVVTLFVSASKPEVARKMADYIYKRTVAVLEEMSIAVSSETGNPVSGNSTKKARSGKALSNIDTDGNIDSLIAQYGDGDIERLNVKAPIVLRLLSPASLPEEPDSRGRGKILFRSAVIGLLCGIMLAFIRHFWISAENGGENSAKIAQLKEHLAFRRK